MRRKASIHEMGVDSFKDLWNLLIYVSLTCRQNTGQYTEHFQDEEDRVSKCCKNDNQLCP
jgi:hypothetical protein